MVIIHKNQFLCIITNYVNEPWQIYFVFLLFLTPDIVISIAIYCLGFEHSFRSQPCNILSSLQFCNMSNIYFLYSPVYLCLSLRALWCSLAAKALKNIIFDSTANNDFWWSTLSMMMNNFHDGAYDFNDWRLILNNAL